MVALTMVLKVQKSKDVVTDSTNGVTKCACGGMKWRENRDDAFAKLFFSENNTGANQVEGLKITDQSL